MALAESQCYTIINTPELSDIYNEMKLKKDLGKCAQRTHNVWAPDTHKMYLLLHRTRRRKCSNRNVEESDQTAVERRTVARPVDDHHSVCDAIAESYDQKVAPHFLGDRAEDDARWQIAAGNDPRVRCLSQGVWTINSTIFHLICSQTFPFPVGLATSE